MTIKTLLMPMIDAEPPPATLALTCALASRLDALATGFFVRSDPRTAIPFMGEALTADAIKDLCKAAEEEATEMAATAKTALFAAAQKAGLATQAHPVQGGAAQWEEVLGQFDDHVGRRARLADLTLVAKPRKESDRLRGDLLREVLFRSGRPLMVVPDGLAARCPQTVAIAWNGRAEAARAMAAAVPLLQAADQSVLVTIGEPHPDRPTAHDAQTYLSHYGIAADIVADPLDDRHVGPTLMARTRDLKADCLVMGAYSHSRWREMILGGVTRHAIHHADLPLLISH
ncbi:MAG: universal stress protein [Rhodothalassiaceae bacterium]